MVVELLNMSFKKRPHLPRVIGSLIFIATFIPQISYAQKVDIRSVSLNLIAESEPASSSVDAAETSVLGVIADPDISEVLVVPVINKFIQQISGESTLKLERSDAKSENDELRSWRAFIKLGSRNIVATLRESHAPFYSISQGEAALAITVRPLNDAARRKSGPLNWDDDASWLQNIGVQGIAVIGNIDSSMPFTFNSLRRAMSPGGSVDTRTTRGIASLSPDLSELNELMSHLSIKQTESDLRGWVSEAGNRIGFVGVYEKAPRNTITVGQCGVGFFPNKEEILTREYPFFREVSLYRPGNLMSGPADSRIENEFRKFLSSPEASGIIESKGFFSTRIDVFSWGSTYMQRKFELMQRADPIALSELQGRFATLGLQNFLQLSTVIRFEKDSYELNARARSDLAQISDFLKSKYPGSIKYAVGYASAEGDKDLNQVFSDNRARAAADYLIALGVDNVGSTGMDEIGYLGCDSDRASVADRLSRRVEIWVER